MDLSVIIITYNEEKSIRDCLESVKWAGEIIVVDANSNDRTVEICREYTEKVYINQWPGYSKQKAIACSLATKNWVLSLDADERISPELSEEIKYSLANPGDKNCFVIQFRHYFLGKWIEHCGWNPSNKMRLFQRNYGQMSTRAVHEGFYLVKPKPGQLERGVINHYSYRNIAQYIDKFNRYTTLEAQEMRDNNRKFVREDMINLPIQTFFDMYFNKKGLLDGLHGLVLCVLSSLYVFVTHAKLWSLESGYELS